MEKFKLTLIAIIPLLLIGYGMIAIILRDIDALSRYSHIHLTGANAVVYGLGMVCIGASYFVWRKWPVADDDLIPYHTATLAVGCVLMVVGGVMSAKLW
jgi:hypothetical protein